MSMPRVLAIPGSPDDTVGVLNVHGDVLPVIDPRARLGVPRPAVTAEQSLVLLSVGSRFLVWVDGVEGVVAGSVVGPVARLGDTLLPLLSPTALEPRALAA
jgi:chemotaxis signal transduction protein